VCLGALLCVITVTALSGTAGAGASPHKPGPVTDLTGVAVNTAVAVSWSPPAAFNGPAVSSYTVTVLPGYETCVSTGVTSCLVTGLSNHKKYTVKVRAVNSVGAGKSHKVSHLAPNTVKNCAYVGPYANLQGCSLFNQDLTGDNLSYANMTGADLTQATVDGVDFNDTQLSGVTIDYLLQNGTITGTPASLPSGGVLVNGYILGPGIYLTGVQSAALSGVDFTGTGLSLAHAVVQSDNFSGDTFPASTDFDGANMVGDDLTGASLVGADLSGIATSSLDYLSLSGADLENADLSGINLLQDNVEGTNLTNTDLSGASMNGLVQDGTVTGVPASLPSGTLLVGGWFVGPYQYLQGVPGTVLANTDFSSTGLELNNAIVQSDDLNGDTFAPGTDFSSSSLAGTTFEGDSLVGADFSNTHVSGADFTNADLTGASFTGDDTSGVIWSNTTCPDGTNSDNDGGSCAGDLG
jgi:uncharacterized protein YjbI with pentapeptide repeats